MICLLTSGTACDSRGGNEHLTKKKIIARNWLSEKHKTKKLEYSGVPQATMLACSLAYQHSAGSTFKYECSVIVLESESVYASHANLVRDSRIVN